MRTGFLPRVMDWTGGVEGEQNKAKWMNDVDHESLCLLVDLLGFLCLASSSLLLSVYFANKVTEDEMTNEVILLKSTACQIETPWSSL
jgi:hypothetical protein